MITTLIADDEKHARERLRELLDRFGIFDIVAEAVDGNEALSLMLTRGPRVAFLDITMPGISVFTAIPSLQNPPLIIFQTAYSEHAANAFEIDAVDYLLKPIRYERLEKAVSKILSKLGKGTQPPISPDSSSKPVEQVTIKVGGKTRIIAAKDIVRISFIEDFCYLYTENEKMISDKYLSYYEEKLHGGRFYRTSRTDIINLDCIAVINKEFQGMYTIELKNGMQVDLSRRRAQLLRKIIDF
ncbi:MAG: response regulator [Chitinivibrionales bacterium]|nr:response regulator [Chitinivibrionales bacterium]MBD3357117.1 response regulator [Chitinivibrionales bacterium]